VRFTSFKENNKVASTVNGIHQTSSSWSRFGFGSSVVVEKVFSFS